MLNLHLRFRTRRAGARGFGLIDAMVAMVILAVGMLALVRMQTRLVAQSTEHLVIALLNEPSPARDALVPGGHPQAPLLAAQPPVRACSSRACSAAVMSRNTLTRPPSGMAQSTRWITCPLGSSSSELA